MIKKHNILGAKYFAPQEQKVLRCARLFFCVSLDGKVVF
jgi:hypothetical protein